MNKIINFCIFAALSYSEMKRRTFSPGGIHPPQLKSTAGSRIIAVDAPVSIVLPLGQHIGRGAISVVGKGDRVEAGQPVAVAGPDGVSAAVHTPFSGRVSAIGQKRDSRGLPVESVSIDVEPGQSVADVDRPLADVGPVGLGDVVKAASDAGIVGLGGAAFPTAFKIGGCEGLAIDAVVINGAECEPVLTCDDAMMRVHPDEIVAGARLIKSAVGATRVIIGVELNKPEAIFRLQEASAAHGDVSVVGLQTKYPQGGERQLVQAVTGRYIAQGCLPMTVGVVVQNVSTARALYRAMAFGEPLVNRIVTVAGEAIGRPGNYLVPIGMSVAELLGQAGADLDRIDKLVAGGPMMGRVIEYIDGPVTKSMSAVLALSGNDAFRRRVEPCVRCGRCVDVCPNVLEPYLIATYGRLGRVDDAAEAGALMCMECGSCSYVCPSSRPITDMIRVAKYLIRKSRK